jgi:hypothetical protein
VVSLSFQLWAFFELLWWGGGRGAHARSSKHRPTQIGALGCASSRAGARSTAWLLGTFLLHTNTNHLRNLRVIVIANRKHRFCNRRDGARARVCFVARLGLECSGCLGEEMDPSAVLFRGRERLVDYFLFRCASPFKFKSKAHVALARSIFSAHSAIKFSTTFFVLNRAGSLLWEVRELAMLRAHICACPWPTAGLHPLHYRIVKASIARGPARVPARLHTPNNEPLLDSLPVCFAVPFSASFATSFATSFAASFAARSNHNACK